VCEISRGGRDRTGVGCSAQCMRPAARRREAGERARGSRRLDLTSVPPAASAICPRCDELDLSVSKGSGEAAGEDAAMAVPALCALVCWARSQLSVRPGGLTHYVESAGRCNSEATSLETTSTVLAFLEGWA